MAKTWVITGASRGFGKEWSIAALERAISNRFTAEPSAIHPVAHIWLARAHAKAGNTDAARRAYDDAFAFWKDADDDIPILVEARGEYAALGR